MPTAENVPAEPSPRRSRFPRLPPRFSLRAMLILIGVPCALLALWAGYRERFARQRRAMENIARAVRFPESRGLYLDELTATDAGREQGLYAWDGALEFCLEADASWARLFYPAGTLRQVEMARVGEPDVENVSENTADRIVSELAQLDTLGRLELSLSPIRDRHIRTLSSLPSLYFLGVESPHLTDGALESIGRLRELSHLSVSSPLLTDRGVRRLAELKPGLWNLDIDADEITGTGLEAFQSLRELRIAAPHLSHDGFRSMGSCSALTYLSISRAQIAVEDASALAGLSHVKNLILRNVDVAEPAWVVLFSQGHFELIDLDVASTLTAASLAPLQHHPLRNFELRGVTIGPGAMEVVARISTLRSLWLCDVKLGPSDVAALSGATQLSELLLSRTTLTQANIATLRSKLSWTQIEAGINPASQAPAPPVSGRL